MVKYLSLSIVALGIARAYSQPLPEVGECHEETLEGQESNGRFYTSRPLGKQFGIEALDIDLSNPSLINDDQFIAQLKQDLVDHRAVLFRSQSLSAQQQVDFSEAMGRIDTNTEGKHPKTPHPYVYLSSNNATEGSTKSGVVWHVDGTPLKTPYTYSTLYLPSVIEGGDTHFIPLKELYDSFTADEKEYYNKIWIMYSKRKGAQFNVIHPLVYMHPFRHDHTLLIHGGYNMAYFADADISTKDEVVYNGIDMERMMQPSKVYNLLKKKIESQEDNIGMQMKWDEGDFLIFDNLGLIHRASEGTQASSEEMGLRILHRTSIVRTEETIPTKFDGRKTFTVPPGN